MFELPAWLLSWCYSLTSNYALAIALIAVLFTAGLEPLWLAGGATFGYVQKAPKVAGKIYLDVGDREAGGRMRDSARRMWHLLQKRGYREGRDLLYIEEKDGVHNEEHWAARLPDALRFLLK